MKARGTRNGRSKLANIKIRWARMGWRIGIHLKEMAAILGVDESTLGKAIRGDTWKHVK